MASAVVASAVVASAVVLSGMFVIGVSLRLHCLALRAVSRKPGPLFTAMTQLLHGLDAELRCAIAKSKIPAYLG